MKISNFLIVFPALIMFGCQATHQDAGSGYINLSRMVKVRLQSYLDNPNGTYFAVSTDGQFYGYSVCSAGRYGCTEGSGAVALRSCHSRSKGMPCKIYAMDDKIVWRGAVASGQAPKKVSTKTGSGPLTLSSKAKEKFQKYLNLDSPEYFSVSPDGVSSGYSFCHRPPCMSLGLKALAVSDCVQNNGGLECQIYAIKRKVVWKGHETTNRIKAKTKISPKRQGTESNRNRLTNEDTEMKLNDKKIPLEIRLEKLKSLLDRGLITEEEATQKRKEILENL